MSEQITTPEELDALPVGTRYRDRMGDVGTIVRPGIVSYPETVDLTTHYAARYLPGVVLDGPDVPAPSAEDRAALAREAQAFLDSRDMTWEMRNFLCKVRDLYRPACTAPVEPDNATDDATDDEPTVADTLDALRDVAHTLWALVDDVTPLVHAEQDGPRRLELRAVQEHTAQAWAQAQHAVIVLQALVALDGRPEAPRG